MNFDDWTVGTYNRHYFGGSLSVTHKCQDIGSGVWVFDFIEFKYDRDEGFYNCKQCKKVIPKEVVFAIKCILRSGKSCG